MNDLVNGNNMSIILIVGLGALAVVFVLTSLISFCPLYAPFKFSTKKKEGAKLTFRNRATLTNLWPIRAQSYHSRSRKM